MPWRKAIFAQIDRKRKAAILLISLRPELAAQLFNELEPEYCQEITSAITTLPEVVPQARYEVLTEFLAITCARSERANSVKQATELVEELAKEDPSKTAAFLRQFWLSPQQRHPRYQCQVRPPSTWGKLQKVAILMSMMKPALRRTFYEQLTSEERQRLKSAQDFMPPISAENRLKAQLDVLEEFALPHCPGLTRNVEFRMFIGRQLGDLLRSEPEAIANKVRDLWLKPTS